MEMLPHIKMQQNFRHKLIFIIRVLVAIKYPDFTKNISGGKYTPGKGSVSDVHKGAGHDDGRAIDVTDHRGSLEDSIVIGSKNKTTSIINSSRGIIYAGDGTMKDIRLAVENYTEKIRKIL